MGIILLAVFACQDTGCNCVEPLDAPLAENKRMYDAVQVRITPHTFEFIENNLTDMIDMFLEGGLSFPIEYIEIRECVPGIGWPCVNLDVCEDPCLITAEISNVVLNRIPPNILAFSADVYVSGTIEVRRFVNCDVTIKENLPIIGYAEVELNRDVNDHLLHISINPDSIQASISKDHYNIDCSWTYEWLINAFKRRITNEINKAFAEQIETMVPAQIDAFSCLPCDFYSQGCPSGSYCDNSTNYCMSGGNCRIKPLGMVGTIDFGTFFESLIPDMDTQLDFFVAAGQYEPPEQKPMIINRGYGPGVELRVIGGVDVDEHECVPTPVWDDIPTNATPDPQMVFRDVVPGTNKTYMAGISIADKFLDWMLYKAHMSGVSCVSIGTETVDLISSTTISLMGMSSLNILTGGQNLPVRIKTYAGDIPYVEIGSGTFTTDAEGNTVIDQPLIYVFINNFTFDLWVPIDERWVRVVTLTMNLNIDAALDLTDDNMLIPIFDENNIRIENIRASNYELLNEDPEAIGNIIPTLVEIGLPLVLSAVQPVELPSSLQGFELEIISIKGDMRRASSKYHEYLSIYANLAMESKTSTKNETNASLAEIIMPEVAKMSIYAKNGPTYPTVVLNVSSPYTQEAEYSYRIDDGYWHLFKKGPKITINNPLFLLAGKHKIEVRSRIPGNHLTLDPTPAVVHFDIPSVLDDTTSEESYQPNFNYTSDGQPVTDNDPSDESGCSCGSSSATGVISIWFLFASLLLFRKRSRS
jgi:hypothetical protein